MAIRVLLIDDDVRLHELLASYLDQNGLTVTVAADGRKGLAALEGGTFDAVLLDLMMPGLDGIEVCKRIRQKSNIPVVMLTAKGDETDRVVGLELGADDYVSKPFSPRELLARLRAVLRRARPDVAGERLNVGDIAVDVPGRIVTMGGKPVDLTGIEFDVLVALVRRAGRVVARDALLEEAGRGDVVVGERTVDVHVSHLRQKLGDDPRSPRIIKTVRGVGYVFARDGEAEAKSPESLVNPLLCYVRARLQRRLFVWFGLTILLTGLAVSSVLGATGGAEVGWRRETQRVSAFMSGRFERVWDSPAERDELAQAMSRDLDSTVELEGPVPAGPGLAPLAHFGAPCNGTPVRVAVRRGGQVIGNVAICAERYSRFHEARAAMALSVTGLVLWFMSSRIARRLSRPMGELARVARELGSGNFTARVRLPDRHRFGESAALAVTMNDMAARIERHLAEQRELLAAVSHELRTPLARVRLLTEMARDQGATAKTLDDLDREVMEMDALVGDLLASSRMDFAALSRRPIDAVEAASRALERAGADPTALVVERAGDEAGPIPFRGDATLLARALANLIDNARRHGGGVESLRVKRENGHVAFEVEDHGEGFVAGEEGRIFEPFYRRSEEGSLGLGLSLVKRIAEAHGGRAYAENREEGGARVGVEVPV